MDARYDLAGRRAIVTGGAGGLGRGIAEALRDAGATVELWDAHAERLAEAATVLGVGQRQVDITDAAVVDAAAAAAFDAHRRIDILVNNAGILGEVRPIWETDPANF